MFYVSLDDLLKLLKRDSMETGILTFGEGSHVGSDTGEVPKPLGSPLRLPHPLGLWKAYWGACVSFVEAYGGSSITQDRYTKGYYRFALVMDEQGTFLGMWFHSASEPPVVAKKEAGDGENLPKRTQQQTRRSMEEVFWWLAGLIQKGVADQPGLDSLGLGLLSGW
ncbi:hypothetical protein Nepgr_027146 [Nepenthes gracilis]|uniref:Uncharacterized protein n=1 Tax=Nepenthes gracilis TaxID=150966 RepID=A0AAD3Y177_NEPGR|nr:hypothetical protein Nepgr_027146 [Nepenthes gracilis]